MKNKILILFDVDGTLTKPREKVTEQTLSVLKSLRTKFYTGVVGGSDLSKQMEQLGYSTNMFDYCFAENGLLAYKNGKLIEKTSLVSFLGEKSLQSIINWTLMYIAALEIPVKRGTFIEFRQGMLNISPIGRNCSKEERNAFEEYDNEHNIRSKMVENMKKQFPYLSYSIGGQISFDVFPKGWDKTYCPKYIPENEFEEIHFFGDKTFEGGNDFEIYSHPRVKRVILLQTPIQKPRFNF